MLGAILLAFVYYIFIINNQFAPAGLNGIATMIQYKTGFSIGYMSLIINVPLCTLAYFLIALRKLSVLFFGISTLPSVITRYSFTPIASCTYLVMLSFVLPFP